MSKLTRGRSRLAALGTAGALAASALAVAPAAQAAETPVDGAALTWGTSRFLNEHLTAQQFTAGATEKTDGVVTFTGGAGTVDPVAKTARISYKGSAAYAFANEGVSLYGVTFTDPSVVVAADGSGQIVADVSWFAPGGATGSAEDTVLTTFTGAATTWSRYAFEATPSWAGTVPADTYGEGKPVNGESWAQAFVQKLPSAVMAAFYSSGSNPTSDAKKAPAAFTAQFAAPKVTAEILAASYADGVDLKVTGSNFSAVTKPGDDGVYVGVAPANAQINFDDRVNGTKAMVAVDWVTGKDIVDGSFVKALNLPTAKLVKGTSYVLYTWQAHTHSNTTQDTATPLTLDWSKLEAPKAAKVAPTVTVKVSKAPTTRKAGKAVVRVKGAAGVATGKVQVQLLQGKKVVKKLGKPSLVRGKVVVKLPKLARGTYKVRASYAGNDVYKAKTVTVKVKVVKARKK